MRKVTVWRKKGNNPFYQMMKSKKSEDKIIKKVFNFQWANKTEKCFIVEIN